MGVYTNMAANYVNNIGDNPVLESLQFSLDMQKADHAMFEALIELDFDEVYQEAGLSVYTEADIKAGRKFSLKAIKAKVVEYINKFIDMIKRVTAKIVAKLQDIFNKDKKLVKKYGERFKKNASSHDFKEEVEIPDFKKIENEMRKLNGGNITGGDDKFETYSGFLSNIRNLSTPDEVTNRANGYVDHIKQTSTAIRETKYDSFFTKVKGILGGGTISSIDSYMNTGLQAAIKDIKDNAKRLQSLLEKEKKYYESDDFFNSRRVVDDEGNEDQAAATLTSAISKGSISILSAFSSVVTVQRNFNINLIKRTYANVRKLYVACSSESKKEEKDDQQAVNASYEYALGVLSDTYIEEAFA